MENMHKGNDKTVDEFKELRIFSHFSLAYIIFIMGTMFLIERNNFTIALVLLSVPLLPFAFKSASILAKKVK